MIRNVLRVADSLPTFNMLGVILILRSPERARFGDRIAGIRVVMKRQSRAQEGTSQFIICDLSITC